MTRSLLVIACCVACATAALLSNTAADAVAPPVVVPVEDRLRALAVTDDDFARRVLYTWTTPDSIAELRATHRLLVATASSGAFVSPFNSALAWQAGFATGEQREIAGLLVTRPELVRRRYAWPAPFATVLGLGAHGYGTALIRIELRRDAWIGRFEPQAREPFSFVDTRGRSISNALVLAHPERIAAIFHVRPGARVESRFREYVVCNEAMVASWSVATPEIRVELDAELALLEDLRPPVSALEPGEVSGPAAPAWAHAPASTVARWRAALAFDNDHYRPTAPHLDAIAAALRAYDASGPALVVTSKP
jgi:hypothetical protein